MGRERGIHQAAARRRVGRGDDGGEARQAVRQGSVGEVNNNVVPQLVKQRPRLAPSMYHLAW